MFILPAFSFLTGDGRTYTIWTLSKAVTSARDRVNNTVRRKESEMDTAPLQRYRSASTVLPKNLIDHMSIQRGTCAVLD